MAKKRVEVALQDEVNTQEEWETILQKEGLLVVDIYQDWCGPCKAVVGLFRRLKTELNDDLLRFAVAKADTIDSFERYRGKCEPYFLLYGGGYLVAAVQGVNSPELEKNIIEKLKQEHEVMKGEAERIEIRDPLLVAQELAEAELKRKREEEEEVPQEVTIVVLKPDIVSSGRANELIDDLIDNGIEIIERKEHWFSSEDVDILYDKLKEMPFFSSLVEFMTSGPSEVLLCTKGPQGVIEEIRNLIGPAVYEDEEENENEEKLRAKYASDLIKNAIHASDSKQEAARELAFFYPDFQPPIVTIKRIKPLTMKSDESSALEGIRTGSDMFGLGINLSGLQRTVALLRPYAYQFYKDEILEQIKVAGFIVAIEKELQLTKELAEQYYTEHKNESYFDEFTTMMSSGPILALLLAKQDAITTLREMLGPDNVKEAKQQAPDSLRAKFTMKLSDEKKSSMHSHKETDDEQLASPDDVGEEEVKENEEENMEAEKEQNDEVVVSEELEEKESNQGIQRFNLIHGSKDEKEAEKDMKFFFPIERTLAAIKPDAYANRDEIIGIIRSAGFHVAAKKDIQLTIELAKELYEDCADKPFFNELINHMISGRTLFMVLTRQNAVAGWRQIIGSPDPDKAAEESPDSIRATYGRDLIANAVHGSTTIEHAERTIQLIFGDIDEETDKHETHENDLNTEEQERILKSEHRIVMEAESAEPEDNMKVTEQNDQDATQVEPDTSVAHDEPAETAQIDPEASEVVPIVSPEIQNESAPAGTTLGETTADTLPSDVGPVETQPDAVAENQNASVVRPDNSTRSNSRKSLADIDYDSSFSNATSANEHIDHKSDSSISES